ncbi:transporter substrate-binding domain-containing protein [Pseudoduganella sp. LjRoot289]|uniref:substrate-binding periplasmic protein n=1 Tax=Pseudoduganella sp. LjRoot289 TaxID=3342314 RepID=UPI003ED02BB0
MKSGPRIAISLMLAGAGALAAPPAPPSIPLAVQAPITVAWSEKPPYYYQEDGVDKGYMLAYGKAIFAAAGVEARFVPEPQKRIWARFRDGTRNYCSMAWYYLPDRVDIVQYTLPIHTDPPQIVLVAPKALAQVKSHATLASMLADPKLTLGIVDGSSYGPQLDARIARSSNQIMRRTVPSLGMIRMLAAGRASYLLTDRDVWEFTRPRQQELAGLAQYDVPDMPSGLQRHIVCSLDVPAASIGKLNRAIRNAAKPALQAN